MTETRRSLEWGLVFGEGENRAVDAAKMAINSPLLETSIDGAKGILLNISGSSDLSIFEVNEAAEIISEAADPDANIIFGSVIDESLGDKVQITVVATGFNSSAKVCQNSVKQRLHLVQHPLQILTAVSLISLYS